MLSWFIQFKTLLNLLYSHFSKDTEKIYKLWLDYNYVGLVQTETKKVHTDIQSTIPNTSTVYTHMLI